MSDFKSDICECDKARHWKRAAFKASNALTEEHARLTDTERQLREAQERCERLEEALQMLVDEQNGPPLLKHEQDWLRAMSAARDAISEPDEMTQAMQEGKVCICADPENCTEPVPGYICKRTGATQ